jgi:hypothetical protein
MLTAPQIAILQAALDTLALIGPKQVANPVHPPAALDALAIRCDYCKPTHLAPKGRYRAACDLTYLRTSATGATRAAALRNLFKALRNAASWNAPTLRVPMILCEPTKAKAEERAARKANAQRAFAIALDRAAKAMEAERAAPTIIAAASHDQSLAVTTGSARIVCNNLAAPKFVEAPIIPAGAEPGTEGIFKALLGLRTEQKIVALVNSLHFAGVTIHRLDEDGAPIIRAVGCNALGTCTVLNL